MKEVDDSTHRSSRTAPRPLAGRFGQNSGLGAGGASVSTPMLVVLENYDIIAAAHLPHAWAHASTNLYINGEQRPQRATGWVRHTQCCMPKPARELVSEETSRDMSAVTANNWWASAKLAANAAAAKTRVAAATAKLRAEVALVDREINGRKKQFGVEMYDHMSPLISSVDFYTGPMYDDEEMTELVRPLLIATHKEVAALEAKVCQLKEDVSAAEVGRTSAYGAGAETVGDKFKKAGKTVASAGVEGKLKAELLVLQNKVTATKQEMGVELFGQFAILEDRENWLPKDRVVRNIYDSCRQDIEAIELKRRQKQQELAERGFNG